jgi:cytochrome P450
LTTTGTAEYPSVEAAECPFPIYDRLRNEAPVYQLPDRPNMYFLTRYEDIRAVLGDPASFTSEHHLRDFVGFELLIGRDAGPPPMIDADDPLHKELRTMTSGALRPARVKSYEPVIRSLVDEIIDGFIDQGKVEFVEQFSHALPVRLTLELMGSPKRTRPRFASGQSSRRPACSSSPANSTRHNGRGRPP